MKTELTTLHHTLKQKVMGTLKCKLIMLEGITTEAKLWAKDGTLLYFKQSGAPIGYKPQHLYLTSNREIQAGDCIECEGKVDKVTEVLTEDKFPYRTTSTLRFARSSSQKIEATTDKSLNLSLIPESFIQKYVQMQGKIDEVLVEVERSGWTGNASTLQIAFGVQELQLKTRVDGTVIIHKLKDSWIREELKEACWKAFQEGARGDGGYMIDQQERDFEVWFLTNY